mmetsp:Transcript_30934/g.98765  ORF Transcript_30934/g.98765 Transcript_30934/m.98765 type:complete len:275 (-) Transcript_30934:24-848(-)|eukprot:CAMPEP_0182853466 /NCGR_PEP_ID=MMETSP0034_2-20130328/715_1 /TAXON_ID=156128 /ORGANISM="Nephroselmis pyriformis, Strain CCMP717" /LENGTH=274 /DNA_ID=CAMNT_0024984237 /DNA_START=73 /DNA_END=897 /DNA_ORIENTATION=-
MSGEYEEGAEEYEGIDDARLNPVEYTRKEGGMAPGETLTHVTVTRKQNPKGGLQDTQDKPQKLFLHPIFSRPSPSDPTFAQHPGHFAGPDTAEHPSESDPGKKVPGNDKAKKKKADPNRFLTADRKKLQHWVKEGCPGGVPVIAGELNRSIGAVERMLGNAPNIKQTTKVPADPPHTHVPLTMREPAPGLPPLPTPWVVQLTVAGCLQGWVPNDKNPDMKVTKGKAVIGGDMGGMAMAGASGASLMLTGAALSETKTTMAARANLTMSSVAISQ